MLVDTVLYNTKIHFRGNLVKAGLAINEGKIVKIAKYTNLPRAQKKINLNGCITLPGLIDSHVHLRDQQLFYKETFVSGTAAAAVGGITSVIDMPNNKPVTMDSFSLKKRMKLAKNRILVNVAFNSAFPKNLEEIAEIIRAGAIAFKLYLSSRIGGIDILDDEVISTAFQEVAKTNVPIAVHAEDFKILEERRREFQKIGRNDIEAFVHTHPISAEINSIQRIIQLVKKIGVRVHFCHISSKLGMNNILNAKHSGLPVTCEVTPHHLFLFAEQYKTSGFFVLTTPPLRTKENSVTLWNGLKLGYIDLIASDHAPHSFKEKNVRSVWQAKPGIPGLETFLPLLLTKVNNRELTLNELVKLTSENPAKIFNFQNRGSLDEGKCADLVVVEMKREYTIDSSKFLSKAKFSPFDGINVKGKPIKTFVNGELVMEEGEIIGTLGTGHIV